ncbi:MAG: N-acetylmuramic acid 6-phosphate etherase [Planctomycetota bacterium]|nr:N-acetylmuramic acid 6-phosphate etherase [Planctomycetota bacterium]
MTEPMLPPDRSHVGTEQRHPASETLDSLPSVEIVRLLTDDQHAAVDAVMATAPTIAALVDHLVSQFRQGGRLIYIGAGTSGRLGVLDASECPPTFCSDPGQVIGLIAGGDSALRRSSERREDDPDGARDALAEIHIGPLDTLIAIAAGGTTPYALGALSIAKESGAATAFLTCSPMSPPTSCDYFLLAATGAEILTGSTRLKAGTATKIALNAITTTLFARLGKVFGNLMVDLAATNDKLLDRAIRLLRSCEPDLSREEAMKLLETADMRVKVAIVMRRAGVDRHTAEGRLARVDGDVRAAL